jgi:hypothetical protein
MLVYQGWGYQKNKPSKDNRIVWRCREAREKSYNASQLSQHWAMGSNRRRQVALSKRLKLFVDAEISGILKSEGIEFN